MPESVTAENLRRDIRDRAETDKVLPLAWILLPVAGFGAAFIGIVTTIVFSAGPFPRGFVDPGPGGIPSGFPFFFPIIGVGVLTGIISSVLYVYLFYLLVNRRNKHFSRQLRFFEDLISHLKAATTKAADVEAGISSLERDIRVVRTEEAEKSAALWAILTLIPFVNIFAVLYILYFLGNDFRKHERKEDMFLEDSNKILEKVGIGVNLRRMNPIQDRNFILYLVITIITGGLFGIYWLYTLISDPNNHFRHHIEWEDELMTKISPE